MIYLPAVPFLATASFSTEDLSRGRVNYKRRYQLSTAEAETLAATDACKQIIHFRLFLRELGRKQQGPNILFEDNMAAIALVKNPEASRASRHYQLKLHFLKNLQERSIFEYRHCTTDLQLADSMTKPTPRDLFSKFRAWMGIA